MSEKRRFPRQGGNGEVVRLSWTDAAQRVHTMLSFCFDISVSGLQTELLQRLEPGTLVHIRDVRHRLLGTACVRGCATRGSKYRIGLEFCGGMKWSPEPQPAEPVRADVPSPLRQFMESPRRGGALWH